MLLVKSRELKSSGNKKSYKSGVYWLVSPLFFSSFSAFAAPQSLSNPTSVLSIFLSLLLVIGVVFMLALLMRRFNVTAGGAGQMKVVASLAAGTKERVMVIQVGEEQHLLGVTSQNINHLARLETPLTQPEPQSGAQFKDKLTLALAGKIQQGLAPAKGDKA